ncbi:MAG: M23 family metallopeptidase [Anaerolineae bacterium]|nr:M23 family metallopeptidase [Anaerolineae bacterium]
MTTPFDDKVGIWHWKGDSIAENSIQEVANTLKTWAPHVTQVWVKTSDGANWMGNYDTDPNLRIDGPNSVKRWAQALGANGIEFHAWCVPKGRAIDAEAAIIVQACQQPGVRSMILDVEPYSGFWEGGREGIRPLMQLVRKGLPADFHIGLAVDPRPHHYDSIYPDEWFPFIDSVHLMAYWESFQRPVDEVIDEAFATWRHYGRPLYAILQADADSTEMDRARRRAIETHGSQGVSWWRLGVVEPSGWASINVPISAHDPGGEGGRYGRSIIVTPNGAGFAFGTHTGQPPQQVFHSFQNARGWTTYYKATERQRSQVWARWDPQLSTSGWYEVSVYVSAEHATTLNGRFKLHGIRGRANELLCITPQARYLNQWVPLGVFYFDADNPVAGVVFLNDLTGEDGREIAFDALRWREVLGTTPTTQFLADGFDAPIGVASERASSQVWPGYWFDATGFAVRYRIGTSAEAYHTGADLNLNEPHWDADAHSPIYAAAHGVVTFADTLPGWGNVIVIRHDPLISTGQVVYARYAHVEGIRVQVGQRVVRGEQICSVGDAGGAYPYHLHFDVSPTAILQSQPWHWPKLDLDNLLANYVDPRQFTLDHRPPER